MITHDDQLASAAGAEPADLTPQERAGEASFAPGTIAGVSVPLVGREAELQQLLARFYTLLDTGGAQLVTVVGEPGIGKSRLAFEFRQWVSRLPDSVQYYAFRVDRQMTTQPYSLVRQFVSALFRIRSDDPPDLARTRLERGVSALLGSDQFEKAHFIGQLCGFDFSASPHIRGVLNDARQIRDRGLHYAIQCLAALSARAPMILAIDGFHDADDSSIDVIEHVVRESHDLQLLVICMAQSRLYERRPAWANEIAAATRITLAPLGERESRRLVAEILRKAGKLPAALRNLIVGRAEGNPYYVEELIKMLIADGAISPGPEKWQIQTGRLSRLRIPSTLGELLRARLQALSPHEREFLVQAAVIGRTFWSSAVIQLAEIDQALGEAPSPRRPALKDLLGALERKDLIARQPGSRFGGDAEYAFRHELLHEVAYQQVPPELRQSYHVRAARWLIARSGERPGPYAALVAEHFERAGLAEEAGRWYLRAGRYASDTYAVEDALVHLRCALGYLPEVPSSAAERIECYEILGECQVAIARLNDAILSFARMRDIAAAAADPVAEARALNNLAFVYDNQVEPRLSRVSAQQAIALAEQADDPAQRSLGLVRLAWAEFRLDTLTEALTLGQQALTISEAQVDLHGVARSKGVIGMVYEHLGDYVQAARYLEEALQVNYALGNLRQASIQLNNLGYLANARGDYATALTFLQEDLKISREIGSRVSEIYALSNLGTTLNGLAEHAAAEVEIRRGIQMCEGSRLVIFSDYYVELAVACLGQQRVDEALEAAQQALNLARRAENPREAGGAWRALGMAISQLSDHQGAPSCFAESARLFAETGTATERARTLREWARHELRANNTVRATELWVEARAIFVRAGLSHELARTPEQPTLG